LQISSFIPACEDGTKAVIGISFESLQAVEEFYKSYAHDVGFSVRIGSQNVVLDEVINQRFFCSRQGFKKEKKKDVSGTVTPSVKGKVKKYEETRCGCNAHIYVKLNTDRRYYITSFIEQHNHGMISPDKTPFL
jgi:hypothetical protein